QVGEPVELGRDRQVRVVGLGLGPVEAAGRPVGVHREDLPRSDVDTTVAQFGGRRPPLSTRTPDAPGFGASGTRVWIRRATVSGRDSGQTPDHAGNRSQEKQWHTSW